MQPKTQQKTVCLKQQIYASQENFKLPMYVMVGHLEGLNEGRRICLAF